MVRSTSKEVTNRMHARWRGVAEIRMQTAIGYACILAVAITAHRIGRPDLANSIATFA